MIINSISDHFSCILFSRDQGKLDGGGLQLVETPDIFSLALSASDTKSCNIIIDRNLFGKLIPTTAQDYPGRLSTSAEHPLPSIGIRVLCLIYRPCHIIILPFTTWSHKKCCKPYNWETHNCSIHWNVACSIIAVSLMKVTIKYLSNKIWLVKILSSLIILWNSCII